MFGLIDCVVFYAVSAIFQPYNGGAVLGSRPEAFICTCRTLSFTFIIGDNFFQVHVTNYISLFLLPSRITKLNRGFTPDISFCNYSYSNY